jgi:hypothetical protein
MNLPLRSVDTQYRGSNWSAVAADRMYFGQADAPMVSNEEERSYNIDVIPINWVVPAASVVSFRDALSDKPTRIAWTGSVYGGVRIHDLRRWLASRSRTIAAYDNASIPTVADQVTSELARLRPEWAGPGSVPPSSELIRQVETVLDRLPVKARMPQIEVEEEDGSVALRWIAPDKLEQISLGSNREDSQRFNNERVCRH